MKENPFAVDKDLIQNTISAKLPLQCEMYIRYRDDEQFRLIQPHIAYIGSGNKILLNAYQVTNPNRPDDASVWKDFFMEKIVDVIFTEDEFAIRPDFNPFSKKYDGGIIASVDLSNPPLEINERCGNDTDR